MLTPKVDSEHPAGYSDLLLAVQKLERWEDVHFANMVKLYQKKNWNCFRCSIPDYLVRDCPKDLSKTTQNVCLIAKEGMKKKGGQVLRSQ